MPSSEAVKPTYGNTKTIPLTKGYFAKVDDADYDRLVAFSWNATVCRGKRYVKVYAARRVRSETKWISVYMHHDVMGSRTQTDHADGDGLNNQRRNLRPATNSQNQANSARYRKTKSGFRGVHKSGRKWEAVIRVNGQLVRLGRFVDPVEAASAYNSAATVAFGEFATLNDLLKAVAE